MLLAVEDPVIMAPQHEFGVKSWFFKPVDFLLAQAHDEMPKPPSRRQA
jgi:hypothetical protein